jgi:hypothetical protein
MRKFVLPMVAILVGMFAITLNAAPANAQATRTWVSGVGDDANPCSRTAPCKTWAGAISKTAAAGEIDVLDPGGFGAITITKAITLDGGGGAVGQAASILVSGTPGVTVNAATTDKVVLRNLDIQGVAGGTAVAGTIGVNIVQASSVTVENVSISNFSGACISAQPTSTAVNVFVFKSSLQNCAGGGVLGSATGGNVTRVNVSNSSIVQSAVGFTAGASTDMMIYNSTLSNNGGGGVLANTSTSQVSIDQSTISNNQLFGVHSTNSATIRMSNTSVAYNNGTGLLADAGGAILTWTNNWVAGNATDGGRTGTIAPQ